MLDLHSHIIYDVDDGARTLTESLELAKEYVNSGFSDVIATPHFQQGRYNVTNPELEQKAHEIQQALIKHNIPLTLHLGNEIHYSPEILDLLEKKKINSLAGTSYILLEFSFRQKPYGLENAVFNLQLAGYSPIFAHVERYGYVQENPDWLAPFIEQGVLMQCNLAALDKPQTKDYQTIIELLRRNYVHLFGTDTHQLEWRTPNVTKQLKALESLLTKEAYQAIIIQNPYLVLKDESLDQLTQSLKETAIPDKKPSFLARVLKKLR